MTEVGLNMKTECSFHYLTDPLTRLWRLVKYEKENLASIILFVVLLTPPLNMGTAVSANWIYSDFWCTYF